MYYISRIYTSQDSPVWISRLYLTSVLVKLTTSCSLAQFRWIESRWEIPIDFSWKAWCLNSFFLRRRLRLSTRNLTAPLEVRKRSQLLFLPYFSFRKSARILVEIYHTLEITSSSVLKRFQMKAFQKILKHSWQLLTKIWNLSLWRSDEEFRKKMEPSISVW